MSNFYPRSPCGERRLRAYQRYFAVNISIHALLAESDYRREGKHDRHYYFYPRSPCGERPAKANRGEEKLQAFLSTLSLRRATRKIRPVAPDISSFLSTLSLRRATISTALSIQPIKFLSTLSLRRATNIINCNSNFAQKFLSTLSLRRATYFLT